MKEYVILKLLAYGEVEELHIKFAIASLRISIPVRYLLNTTKFTSTFQNVNVCMA